MDNELVSDSESAHNMGEGVNTSSLFTYTDYFNKQFPYYLSIGMTYDQYWNGDCTLVKAYREAEKLKTEKMNLELWLQGMYIYEALCDVSPIFNANAKKGTKPHPYSKEPYPITNDKYAEKQREDEKKVYDKGLAMMEAFMKKSSNKEAKNVGNNRKP